MTPLLDSWDLYAQVHIAFCGVTAVWLSQCRSGKLRRWAPVLGCIGQPAWFFTTIVNAQIGLVLLSVVYTVAWARGFYLQWVVPEEMRPLLKEKDDSVSLPR